MTTPSPQQPDHAANVATAAAWIAAAPRLVIVAGAGMSVDSGLPDFRGKEGLWRAYPPLRPLGLSFEDLSRPEWYAKDPELAWGFAAHLAQAFFAVTPHPGYDAFARWVDAKAARLTAGDDAARCGGFVFTSNVDQAFAAQGGFPWPGADAAAVPAPDGATTQDADDAQRAVYEIHGSCGFLQCTDAGCAVKHGVWPFTDAMARRIVVDEATLRAPLDAIPRCPHCGALSRPNEMLFGDDDFVWARTAGQEARYLAFLEAHAASVRAGGPPGVVVEVGAGLAVPSCRRETERLVRLGRSAHPTPEATHADDECGEAEAPPLHSPGAGEQWRMVRVNLRDDGVPADITEAGAGVAVALGGKDALLAIDAALPSHPVH